MKWFKHDTNAHNDVKLKLLRRKFGAEGYGVYFMLLEIIGEYANEDNIEEWGFVDKHHSLETLADECNVAADKLKEILLFCNEVELLEKRNERLYCEKILKRLDVYAQRVLRKKSKEEQSMNSVRTSDAQSSARVEKSRVEKNREEEILPTDKQSPKVYQRVSLEKATLIQRLGYHLEDTLHTKIVNWGKQAEAVKKMQQAGYTEDQIKKTVTYMATKDEFFADKGFDLTTVANQISRYRAKASKPKGENAAIN